MERGQSGPVTLGVTSWVRLPIMGPRGMTKVPDRYRLYCILSFIQSPISCRSHVQHELDWHIIKSLSMKYSVWSTEYNHRTSSRTGLKATLYTRYDLQRHPYTVLAPFFRAWKIT